jgi:hypothetical protein
MLDLIINMFKKPTITITTATIIPETKGETTMEQKLTLTSTDRILVSTINKQEFVTKDEYLAWRKLWKQTYKMLTEMSRANRRLKAEMKAIQDHRMHEYQWNRLAIRCYARDMMEALVEAKAKSWELRNKAREMAAA